MPESDCTNGWKSCGMLVASIPIPVSSTQKPTSCKSAQWQAYAGGGLGPRLLHYIHTHSQSNVALRSDGRMLRQGILGGQAGGQRFVLSVGARLRAKPSASEGKPFTQKGSAVYSRPFYYTSSASKVGPACAHHDGLGVRLVVNVDDLVYVVRCKGRTIERLLVAAHLRLPSLKRRQQRQD